MVIAANDRRLGPERWRRFGAMPARGSREDGLTSGAMVSPTPSVSAGPRRPQRRTAERYAELERVAEQGEAAAARESMERTRQRVRM